MISYAKGFKIKLGWFRLSYVTHHVGNGSSTDVELICVRPDAFFVLHKLEGLHSIDGPEKRKEKNR